MIPRKSPCLWQSFAQGLRVAKSGFAPTHCALQDMSIGSFGGFASAPHCYPFPSIWLGPRRVEPLFSAPLRGHEDRQAFASQAGGRAGQGRNFSFAVHGDALNSGCITTTCRGVTSCGNSSFFFSSLPPLPPVCRIRVAMLPSAPWAVQRRARLSRMQRAAARPKGRLLARSSVACLAASSLACRPATDLTAAFAASEPIIKRPVGVSPGWPFVICAPETGF